MTRLLNLSPVVLAIVCYLLAGVFKADPGVHDNLLVLAGLLVGWVFQRPAEVFGLGKEKSPGEPKAGP